MTDIPYRIIRSRRKTISLEITPAGTLVVRCPEAASIASINALLERKRPWIESHRSRLSSHPPQPPLTAAEIQDLADRAMEIIPKRVAHFAPLVGVTYHQITIRNQRSRWGSCSSLGNLNFNCLLLLCPPQVLDYVVVHELCHRLEMNHSSRFWSLVEQTMPDYRIWESWLKEHGRSIISRMSG